MSAYFKSSIGPEQSRGESVAITRVGDTISAPSNSDW